jgi:hypothetical protein
MCRNVLFGILLFGAEIMWVKSAPAQITEVKLTSSDGAQGDWFGRSVSISGDCALVGAALDENNGTTSGSAYVFRRDGANWVEEAKLIASDGSDSVYFGGHVSLSGDYALVGAALDDDNGTNSGSAYIFRREGTSWIEESKLTSSDGAMEDRFGGSVSVSGDYALVGAGWDDGDELDLGSAYVFRRVGAGWVEEAKLTASDGALSDYLGWSVSISGDYAIVGAAGDDDHGSFTGSAYIFRRDWSEWVEEAKLTASDGAAGDWFGVSVSVSGDYAIVGAELDDDNGSYSGSAYVFRRDGTKWVEDAKLLARDGSRDDYFGRSVSISGDYALVGTYPEYFYGDGGPNSGSAYTFHRDRSGWLEQEKLTSSDSTEGDYFGYSVSISGEYALVGAFYGHYGDGPGSAYLYSGFSPLSIVSVSSSVSPSSGKGSFEHSIQLTNDTDSLQTIDIWTEAFGPNGAHKVGTAIYGKSLLPGASHSASTVRQLGTNAPTGDYAIIAYVGIYPDDIMDSSSNTYTKTLVEKGSVIEEKTAPGTLEVFENYPNPFNPSTTIRYALSEDAHVTLRIYNMLGQIVATLVDEYQTAGAKHVVWDGTDELGEIVSSAVYISRMTAGGLAASKRILFLK